MDLTPNLWCKFDTGAITTNDGTDAITLVNTLTTNAGISVRGDNSASFNGTTQYLSGTIEGIANNSWSISGWFFFKGSGLYFSIVVCMSKGAGHGFNCGVYV